MIKVLIPGSFDPITIGHLDLIQRASNMFDKVYIGVMVNDSKNYLFSSDERVSLIRKCLSNLPNVEVVSSEKLTVELCRQLNCKILLKGVRTNTDYEYELNQANINRVLNKDIETILMLSKPNFSGISSSSIKSIWNYQGDIKDFVPKEIYSQVIEKFQETKR